MTDVRIPEPAPPGSYVRVKRTGEVAVRDCEGDWYLPLAECGKRFVTWDEFTLPTDEVTVLFSPSVHELSGDCWCGPVVEVVAGKVSK